MKLKLYGEDVNVRWKYTVVTRQIHKQRRTTEKTECILSKNGEIIKQVAIHKHQNDVSNKEAARRFSFLRLIQELFPDKSTQNEQREDFWKQYFDRKKKETPTPVTA